MSVAAVLLFIIKILIAILVLDVMLDVCKQTFTHKLLGKRDKHERK